MVDLNNRQYTNLASSNTAVAQVMAAYPPPNASELLVTAHHGLIAAKTAEHQHHGTLMNGYIVPVALT
jgi:hypothetical protein